MIFFELIPDAIKSGTKIISNYQGVINFIYKMQIYAIDQNNNWYIFKWILQYNDLFVQMVYKIIFLLLVSLYSALRSNEFFGRLSTNIDTLKYRKAYTKLGSMAEFLLKLKIINMHSTSHS